MIQGSSVADRLVCKLVLGRREYWLAVQDGCCHPFEILARVDVVELTGLNDREHDGCGSGSALGVSTPGSKRGSLPPSPHGPVLADFPHTVLQINSQLEAKLRTFRLLRNSRHRKRITR